MQTRLRRAVVAQLPACGEDSLEKALSAAGFALAARAESAGEVPGLVEAHRPELLLADAVLPGGDGVALARQINAAALTVYPAILLMVPDGLDLPGVESLNALGAARIGMAPTARDIGDALARLSAQEGRLPPEGAARLAALLDRLGLPDHPGRDMLACAAAIAWRDRRRLDNLRDRIYPAAGRPFGKSGAQAERAIRHAIDVAWRTGEIEQQHEIFGDTIDARRGRPTCGEMIAQLADTLRWEG